MKEVSMNKDMKLSEHSTLGELTKTSYKTEDGNIPSRVAIENLKNLCENWLEDLRYSYNTLYPRDYPQDVVRQAHQPSERSLSLPRSTEGRLLPARLCRLACPRTGRKKHRYL